MIEAVGRPETYKQAFYARDLAGTVVLVGVPTPDMTLELPLIDVFGRGGALKSSWYGDCLPSRDFPMLIDLHLQGRLPLEKFVTETIGLDDVEAAFDKMHARRRAALGGGALMAGPIDHLVTSGQFTLDGGTWDVDNNVWIVGDDDEVLVIDAAHDADAIAAAVGDRRVVAIVCTHAHNDHVNAAPALADRSGAPILLHPADGPLWEMTHPDRAPDRELADGEVLTRRRRRPAGAAHPRPRPRRDLPVRARAGHRLHRRHAVPRRPGRHRPVVLRLRHDHRLDPGPAAHAARRTRSCAPGTATPRRSAPRRRTWRSGSPAATDLIGS